jgi:hypothetical protein
MYRWMHERRGQGKATCSTILWRRTWLRLSTLMAQTWPVSELRASLTLAKVPSPMVFPSSYGPIRDFLSAGRGADVSGSASWTVWLRAESWSLVPGEAAGSAGALTRSKTREGRDAVELGQPGTGSVRAGGRRAGKCTSVEAFHI